MMPVKAKNKSANRAILRKAREMPKRVNAIDGDPKVQAGLKRHAVGCMEAIKDVVKRGAATPKLNPITEKIKQQAGSSRVRTPLMSGRGSNTMLDGLVVRKTGRNWICTVAGTHHGGMRQRKIWKLHELGFTVRRSPAYVRFLHSIGIHVRGTGTFRIPARRPFTRGVNRYLRGQARKANDAELKKRITALVIPVKEGR